MVPVALALCGPAGCADAPEGAEVGRVDVVDLESPAAEGSGEPFVSLSEDGVIMNWLEPASSGETHLLRFARYRNDRWSPPVTVTSSASFFVNWADFPSVVEVDGALVAHWLQRGATGGYDYGVRVARSGDDGATWSAPWTPHVDSTATEHGFVSIFPDRAGGVGLVWLDGRRYARGPDGSPPTEEMTLRYRRLGPDGRPGPETLVDDRICDCCQTDAAVTSRGPVVVYRDRSPEEIRDIRLARLEGGAWTDAGSVHEDGWEIAACPVNGPAVAAREGVVAVAWFTAAGDEPTVRLAFSADEGDTFDAPLTVDDGDPVGRVDIVMLADGSALVSWLERSVGGAEVRLRRVAPDGRATTSAVVATSSAARASGFPRMAPLDEQEILMAWTDVDDRSSRVRVARAGVPSW